MTKSMVAVSSIQPLHAVKFVRLEVVRSAGAKGLSEVEEANGVVLFVRDWEGAALVICHCTT
jgi:hypothetical protein